MKWLTMIVLTSITTVGGVSSPVVDAEARTPLGVQVETQKIEPSESLIKKVFKVKPTRLTLLEAQVQENNTLLEREQQAYAQRVQNTENMRTALAALKKTAGRTGYVFSGNTPQGWDCSGLVYWLYQEVGTPVEHSATAQYRAGELTESPMPGDIVAFRYKGSKSSFHTGIYLGNGKLIHAYSRARGTVIQSVADVAKGNNAIATYTRVIEQEPTLP
jgi:cell wall-associated NlpC family hydrolase